MNKSLLSIVIFAFLGLSFAYNMQHAFLPNTLLQEPEDFEAQYLELEPVGPIEIIPEGGEFDWDNYDPYADFIAVDEYELEEQYDDLPVVEGGEEWGY